jgi:segregation and condensation protein B
LPTLAEIRDLDSINRELELSDPDKAAHAAEEATGGDAETDDEIIAESAEILTGDVVVEEVANEDVQPVSEATDDDRQDEIQALVEAADNVVELETELKKSADEQE